MVAGFNFLIHPNGSKYWRFSYYWARQRQEIHLGQYPDISLAKARELRDEARRDVASDVNPRDKKKATQIAREYESKNTFEALANDWLEQKSKTWTDGHINETRQRLKTYILLTIGPRPAGDIKTPELVHLFKDIEARGAETAKRCRIIVRGVFLHAMNLGLLESDPTTMLAAALLHQ